MDIFARRASQWTYDHLTALCDMEAPESVRLELKRDLPLADGAVGWRSKRKIHSSERDGLAREIVALANAYGGVLVIGIEESNDAPKRASHLADPLPDIHELVDRLRTSVATTIDPPISGLEIEAISGPQGGSDGYIVVTVPRSFGRPHGHSRPPAVFLRRDDRSEAATMRDIQNMFWEVRSDRDRIESELERWREKFDQFSFAQDLLFQFVAVSERVIAAHGIAAALKDGSLIQGARFHGGRIASATDFPSNIRTWKPTATGAEFKTPKSEEFVSGQVWEVDETGIVAVTGTNNLQRGRSGPEKAFYPEWYCKSAGTLAALTGKISKWAGYEGTWVMAGRFSSAIPLRPDGDRRSYDLVDLTKARAFRPVRLAPDFSEKSLGQVADRIWATFGVLRPEDDTAIIDGFREETRPAE